MYFEVLVSAIAKKLRAAWPEVGEAGDVLFGRQGSCLVETDRGHAWLLLKRRDLFQRIELKARISRKRQVQCRRIAIAAGRAENKRTAETSSMVSMVPLGER
jgi:hypothetical protein